jgi:hypothetical protein
MENEFISRIDLASSLIDAKETKGHSLTHAEVIQFIRKFPAAKVVTLEHHKEIKGILEHEVETLVDILDREQPRGEWVVEITGYHGKDITSIGYKCSLCGRRIAWIPSTEYPNPETFLKGYPYCHCGAKMGVPNTKGGVEND